MATHLQGMGGSAQGKVTPKALGWGNSMCFPHRTCPSGMDYFAQTRHPKASGGRGGESSSSCD